MSTTWEDVQQSMERNRCTCVMREGMTWFDLRPLGAGCRDGAGYVCPSLDKYRRLLGAPSPSESRPPTPPTPQSEGWSPWDSQVRSS